VLSASALSGSFSVGDAFWSVPLPVPYGGNEICPTGSTCNYPPTQVEGPLSLDIDLTQLPAGMLLDSGNAITFVVTGDDDPAIDCHMKSLTMTYGCLPSLNTCITIPSTAKNKVFDCNNKFIRGPGGHQAFLAEAGAQNITLLNCDVEDWSIGLSSDASDIKVQDSNLCDNLIWDILNIAASAIGGSSNTCDLTSGNMNFGGCGAC
jgi:hypothetical protein